MGWIEPQYSRTQVRKAGDVLRLKSQSSTDTRQAYEVLSNWRSAHAYPMHALLMALRKKSVEICPDPVVVQRLKRAPSIINKLRRFSEMSLDRMQDIGGCRSVVHDLGQVRQLSYMMKHSRMRHILHNEKDYISSPKESGYRCIHLIYKYNATKRQYVDFFVELQLRSQIQHAWATAVEVVDIFTKQALKASLGQAQWKDFFRYVSVEFAQLENAPVDPRLAKTNTIEQVKSLEKELSVMNRLHAFAITTKHIEHQVTKGYQYYVIMLDTENRTIRVMPFEARNLAAATEKYLNLETQYVNKKTVDVVLVSGDSIDNLRKAYPNYFADTAAFASFYNQILNR